MSCPDCKRLQAAMQELQRMTNDSYWAIHSDMRGAATVLIDMALDPKAELKFMRNGKWVPYEEAEETSEASGKEEA